MPLDYLRKIEHATFPLTVEDEQEINCVAVLRAAGLIDAAVPAPSKGRNNYGEQGAAIVTRITPVGRRELEKSRGGP